MEINVTIGNVQLCFIASASSPCPSSTPPKIHTTKNDSEKTVELSHFTGTIKIKSIDGTTPVKAKLGSSITSGKQDEHRKRLARLHQSTHQMAATYGIDPSDTMTTPLHICCASR